MDNNFTHFTHYKFICEKCNFKSSKKNDFNRHILTAKHKKITMDNNFTHFKKEIFKCECSKEFKFLSGLSRHKIKCKFINNENNETSKINEVNELNELNELNENNEVDKVNNVNEINNLELKSLVCKLINENNEIKNNIIKEHQELIKENKELRATIVELIPKLGNTTNNINTTQNNKFNIQVFLNEKCKDAINMSDFIKSIEVNLHQLDFTKQNGLVHGLSKTIMDNMNKLSVYERPLHCTDVKREILYIKDEDVWKKDESKEQIKKAIKKASSKNYNALQEWKTNNPDFLNNDTKTDYFTKTISTIGKSGDATEEKIIKNLCKETYVKDSKD